MKNRIKKIIDYENISYSKFADIIGIQRSGVSHILSGRNNPSLEVVQKILESFSYINTDWLLFGTGTMTKELKQGDLFSSSVELTDNKEDITEDVEQNSLNSVSDEFSDIEKEKEIIEKSYEVKNPVAEIEKIVIFYSDNTMEVYFQKENS